MGLTEIILGNWTIFLAVILIGIIVLNAFKNAIEEALNRLKAIFFIGLIAYGIYIFMHIA